MQGKTLTIGPTRQRAGGVPEALTWPFVVALVVVWLVSYAAGVWWMGHATLAQQRDAEVARAELLADNLSSGIEPLLASEELSAVRRLVSEAGYQRGVIDCRLELSDGRPLADANLDKPQMTVLPADWPETEAGEGQTRVLHGKIMVDRPVPVPGKGEAVLSLTAELPPARNGIKPVLPGAAAIGGLGLIAFMLLYRKMRGRLTVLALIRGALRDASDASLDLSALTVNPKWGPEAAGWNRLITGRDHAEQEAVAQELDRLNARSDGGSLEVACDGLWTGMLLTDGRGRVSYLNGAGAASLQLDVEAAVGKPLAELIADEHLKQRIEQVLSGNGPGRVTHEATAEGPDANTIRVTIRRLSESGGVVLTCEDITQQRVSEAARHDFVSRATHELRTPLTNIRLYVETAQEDGEDDKELRGECLNVISRESQRLERLVSEMLSVSEIEAGSMTIRRDDVRLDQLFKSLEQDYSANAKNKNIDLRFDLPPKLPAVQGDRDKLAIVLQNLLGNAIKYTPEGGKVSVGVDLSATELNVEVRDSGIGIGEDDLPRVFEKFYRANDPRLGDITGSGLGLALSHEIVRLHGGELTAESVLNQGSTFRLVLPINAEGV
ncbi:MAG: ATP-binding protein [Phycisphaeraceae bacterium]